MGIPIPKTLVKWASTVTLSQTAKVICEGDAHITRVLGMGMPKRLGFPYHCDTGGRVERNIGNEVEWDKEKFQFWGSQCLVFGNYKTYRYELFSAGVFMRG